MTDRELLELLVEKVSGMDSRFSKKQSFRV